MDAKALAKSKRAHSLHHSKKPHPSQKPKPTSSGTSDAATSKKPSGKQAREKTRQVQRVSALPSNLDRYEEEGDSGSEDLSRANATQTSDVIVPKSKGADYRHLIAEAQSQFQSNPFSDGLTSFDEALSGDFNQFVGSMLSVRGECLLSWIGGDNFVVEDRTAATPEASFLSLNLNALAEQLEKVDLSQRLFIEADLLPAELHAEDSKVSSSDDSDQIQMASESEATIELTEELSPNEFCNIEIVDQDAECTSYGSGSTHVDATMPNRGLSLVNQVNDNLVSDQVSKFDESSVLESKIHDNANSRISKKKLSTFEATNAEAELDMLLDSFNETKLAGTSGFNSANTSIDFHKESSTAIPQHPRKGPDSSKTASTKASFDDVLEDLLQETSNMGNQNGLSQPWDVKATPHDTQSSSSSHSLPKSKVLEDFDSWLDTI